MSDYATETGEEYARKLETGRCIRWGVGADRCALGYDHLGRCREGDVDQRDALRDQFAVHAPPVPDWFEPAMEPAPTPPAPLKLSEGTDYTEEDQREMERVAGEQARYRTAVDQWKRRRAVNRIAQWPYFYADTVLAERDVVLARREQR